MTLSPNDRLLSLVRKMPEAEAQNRLMRIADREIAVSMMYMREHDIAALLSFVAPAKARRVREELALQRHLAVRYEQYRRTIANVIGQLERAGAATPLRSYLRPRSGQRK